MNRPPSHTRKVVLQLKVMGIEDPSMFDYVTAPSRAALLKALGTLAMLGALDKSARVTADGKRIAALPLDPAFAHLLIRYVCKYDSIIECCQRRVSSPGVDLGLWRDLICCFSSVCFRPVSTHSCSRVSTLPSWTTHTDTQTHTRSFPSLAFCFFTRVAGPPSLVFPA